MSTLSSPTPGTSRRSFSKTMKAGWLVKVIRSHSPSRQWASMPTMPPGASRLKWVTGSVIGTFPISSITVAVQMQLVPDIAG